MPCKLMVQHIDISTTATDRHTGVASLMKIVLFQFSVLELKVIPVPANYILVPVLELELEQ